MSFVFLINFFTHDLFELTNQEELVDITFLRIKVYFPAHHAINKGVMSIAIPELEYFYREMMEIGIVERCPAK